MIHQRCSDSFVPEFLSNTRQSDKDLKKGKNWEMWRKNLQKIGKKINFFVEKFYFENFYRILQIQKIKK